MIHLAKMQKNWMNLLGIANILTKNIERGSFLVDYMGYKKSCP